MKYKIFLDDIRNPDWVYEGTNNSDWVILRSYNDFVNWSKNHDFKDVELMSFDNDLGEDKNGNPMPEGVDVVKYMVFDKGLDISNTEFRVHSSNTARRDYIAGTLNNWKKELLKRKQNGELLKENTEKKIPYKINVPNEILELHNKLNKYGIQTFLVGGCVRDSLLGITPKDYDLATSSIPDRILEALHKEGYRAIETGKAFGVINAILPSGEEVELASFRQDIGSTDSRRPDSIRFTDMKQDSIRRDITYNSMFYDIDREEIIDFVGGIEDLKQGITRTVGKPDERFKEDKLRKLRLIRFSARMDSDIDEKADESLLRDNNLQGISAERIRDEFLKGIKGIKSVVRFLNLLNKYKFFDWIFPNLIIKKDFVEEKDYIVLIAYMLEDNDIIKLKKELNQLTYTAKEIKAIVFLITFLKKYKDNFIQNIIYLKRLCSHSGLNNEQIKKYASYNNLDSHLVNAFLNFRLTVSGEEFLAKGLIGADIAKEIEKSEIENFEKKLSGLNEVRNVVRNIIKDNF